MISLLETTVQRVLSIMFSWVSIILRERLITCHYTSSEWLEERRCLTSYFLVFNFIKFIESCIHVAIMISTAFAKFGSLLKFPGDL